MNRIIGIFGYSGFAREVADICTAVGYNKFYFIAQQQSADEYAETVDFLSEDEEQFNAHRITDFIIGIGSNSIRKKISERYNHLNFINLIHPSATFGIGQQDKIEKSRGNIITAGVRFTCDIEVGNFCIFNLNSTIGHDCIIEDFVNVNPGVNISGNVHLQTGCNIGTNASVLQGKSISEKLIIGQNSIVGAGSVVLKSIHANKTVAGVPAKEISK